jgi:hypothetical protein
MSLTGNENVTLNNGGFFQTSLTTIAQWIAGTGGVSAPSSGTTATAPTIMTYTPAAGAFTFPCQEYAINLVCIFSNGSWLLPEVDFTADTGNSITLANAADGMTSYSVLTGVYYQTSNVIQPTVVPIKIPVGSTTITLPISTPQGFLWIFENSSFLTPGVDFTFTGGTEVTLTTGPTQTTDTYTLIMLQPVSFSGSALQTQVQNASLTFANDTGVVNAYSVTYLPAISAPTRGMRLSFWVANANTGASTLMVNGGTAYAIYGSGAKPLTGGELVGYVEVVWSDILGGWLVVANPGGTQQFGASLNFTGEGVRITGDMTNATWSNQLAFQTTTVNGLTSVNAIPNGTSSQAQFSAYNASNPNNSAAVAMGISSTSAWLSTGPVGTGVAVPLLFYNDGAERMRLTPNGLLAINTTAPSIAGTRLVVAASTTYPEWPVEIDNLYTGGAGAGCVLMKAMQTGTQYVQFFYGTNIIGSITQDGTTTYYNTASDYRLKENVVPLTGALDRVMASKPIQYNFKADESKKVVDGFLAHELAEVVPNAVSGKKDETWTHVTYREGYDPNDVKEEDVLEIKHEITPQTVDHSKVVPLLMAALQELTIELRATRAEVNALHAEVQTLKHS